MSGTDIVHYCKSLATVLKLLSPQQLVYAKYHIDCILQCGQMGILKFDWPQIDVNLSEHAFSTAIVVDTREKSTNCSINTIPAKRFKAGHGSCESVNHANVTLQEFEIPQTSYDGSAAVDELAEEYIQEYRLETDEINQVGNSSNECTDLAVGDNQIDTISNSIPPLDISVIDSPDVAKTTVTKQSFKSITQRMNVPDENGHGTVTAQPELASRRHLTMHYSHYMHNVVPHFSDEEFLLNFRMGRNTVEILYTRLAASTAYRKLRGHGGYEAISPQAHVLAFLWFLGQDKASYRDVADQFSLSVSCLHSVICRVADTILSMKPDVMVRPDEDKKAESATVFATMCNISGVIGCVGATQIKIDKPVENSERYLLWKGHHSVQLQAIIDENERFVDVFVDYHDEPKLMRAIKHICGKQYCLVGTAEYPCLYQLLVPYCSDGTPLTEAQRTFNEHLETVTKKCVHIFTHLKTRFRQLYHLKGRHLSRIVKLVKVCCILHNLASAEELIFLARNDSDYLRERVCTYDSKDQSPTDIAQVEHRRNRITSYK